MRSSILRNIAAGLAGSFVSRNNDSDGYWAVGKLRSLAARLGVDELQIPIRPTADSGSPLLLEIARRYAVHLARLVGGAGCAVDSVAEAQVVIRFAVAWPAGVPHQGTWGDPVACEVHLIDRMGKQASARRVTFCWPHDPTREYRSARSGGT